MKSPLNEMPAEKMGLETSPVASASLPVVQAKPVPLRWVMVFVSILTLCFGKVLYDLAVFAADSELYSHILLIPFVSAFLVWIRRSALPPVVHGSPGLAAIPFVVGTLTLASYWVATSRGWEPSHNDYLSLNVFVYCCYLLGGGLFLLGRDTLRAISFPVCFLVFIIPFPVFLTNWLEIFFQHTSAYAAYLLIAMTRTPMVHDGLAFRLPGITISVGQECSGIHSSLVLFITSLLAGHLFLVTFWKKAALACFIVPLAIARNACRIAIIALLSAHDDPAWIDSALHRRGGPLFFALSLIPFFVLLWYLRKTEGRERKTE